MRLGSLRIAVVALLSAIMAGPAGAQGRGSLPVPDLPDQPWEYQTAHVHIRVRVLTAGLENPWSLEFLPDASLLITERNGRLRHFKDGVLSGPVPGLPAVVADNFISGLHDIKLHPDFARNRLLYWVYNKGGAAAGAGGGRGGGGRFPAWKGNLFVGGVRYGQIPGTGRIQRIVFNDNMEEIRRETLLDDKRWRIRDIRQGPDELLYVITDERNGALLRIEPVE